MMIVNTKNGIKTDLLEVKTMGNNDIVIKALKTAIEVSDKEVFSLREKIAEKEKERKEYVKKIDELTQSK